MNRSAVAIIMVVAAISLAAQEQAPHFEVASIKLTDPPKPGVPGQATTPVGFLPGGRYVARYITGERLLVSAFREEGRGTGLRREQIIGMPSWMTSSMYNIEAKVASPVSTERIAGPIAATLIRSLLIDRFKLKYHFEKRELPFYALVVDKADGSFGPDFKRSAHDCDAIEREREAARQAGRAANVPAPEPGLPLCVTSLGRGVATGSGASMITIANMLTGAAGNTVLDRTGLVGAFDLKLRFSPETQSVSTTAPLDVDTPPSLFTAVREQLGLRLESRREPRDVLVVDYVERPTSN